MYYLGKCLLSLDRRVDGYSWLRRFLNAEKKSTPRVEDARKIVKDLEQRLSENPAAARKGLEGDQLIDAGKPIQAIEVFTAALDLAPLRGDTYVERARAYLFAWEGDQRKEFLNQAVHDLETALLINERNGRAWSMLTVTRYKTEDFGGAADAGARGCVLDPTFPSVWEYRIRACNRAGRYAEAELAATEGIAKGPRAILFLARAEARCGLGKLEAARADLDTAVEKYELTSTERTYRAEVLDRILRAEKGLK